MDGTLPAIARHLLVPTLCFREGAKKNQGRSADIGAAILSQPFGIDELLARVRASLLRATSRSHDETEQTGGIGDFMSISKLARYPV